MPTPVSRRHLLSLMSQGCLAATLPLACGRPNDAKTYSGPNLPLPSLTQAKQPAPYLGNQAGETRDLEQSDSVFSASIASGDPTPNGVILWTRIDPKHYRPDLELIIEVARDLKFTQKVHSASIPGAEITEADDYCVKWDADPFLEPLNSYYYRFIYGRFVSRIGRCRTLPTPQQSLDRLMLGQITCQDFGNGYYAAFRALSQRDDLDFVIHLGDFIYESSGDPHFQKDSIPERSFTLPSGEHYAMDRQDYNTLYRTYRRDSHLQRCLEAHTMIFIPDDHETANDYHWDYALDAPGVPDHPYHDLKRYTLDDRRGLRRDSMRAWQAYTPTRLQKASSEEGDQAEFQIYRSFRFGQLAHISMLDERSFRTNSACGSDSLMGRYVTGCKTAFSDKNSMLGRNQLDWLLSKFEHERARWNLLGNQVPMAPVRLAGSYEKPILANVDGWDGFAAERKFILEAVRYLKLDNFIVLSGDLHTGIASHLKLDFSHAVNFDLDNTVGVEFMTPSISSANLKELITQNLKKTPFSEKIAEFLQEKVIRRNNPHLSYFDSNIHGYATLELTPRACEWSCWSVNTYDPEAKPVLQRRYRKWNLNPLLETVS